MIEPDRDAAAAVSVPLIEPVCAVMVPPVDRPPAVRVPETRPDAADMEPAVEKLAATAAPVLERAPELVTEPASSTPLKEPDDATTEEPVKWPAAERAPAKRVRPPTDRSRAVVRLPTLTAFATDSTLAVNPLPVLMLPATNVDVIDAVLPTARRLHYIRALHVGCRGQRRGCERTGRANGLCC